MQLLRRDRPQSISEFLALLDASSPADRENGKVTVSVVKVDESTVFPGDEDESYKKSKVVSVTSDTSGNKTFVVGGVEFKMIPVAGHTSGFFLIGETEVTNALYKAVTNSTSVTSNNIARYGVSYDDWETFIAKINYATNLTFDIPTVEQWKYAYSGGLQSQGYTYSGSNHPGDVAWYKANSGGTIHEVKTLAPNELGIYDMSGNIAEFIKDPGSTSYYYGGHYNSPESDLKSTSRTGYISSSSTPAYAGLRVVLICN
jgi:formylglycine-generating enzyme required for sulfatase activity